MQGNSNKYMCSSKTSYQQNLMYIKQNKPYGCGKAGLHGKGGAQGGEGSKRRGGKFSLSLKQREFVPPPMVGTTTSLQLPQHCQNWTIATMTWRTARQNLSDKLHPIPWTALFFQEKQNIPPTQNTLASNKPNGRCMQKEIIWACT